MSSIIGTVIYRESTYPTIWVALLKLKALKYMEVLNCDLGVSFNIMSLSGSAIS